MALLIISGQAQAANLEPRIINSTLEDTWNGYTVGIHLVDSYNAGVKQAEENPTMLSQYCVGTLVSPSVIVTSAWCVTNDENHKFIEKLQPKNIFVTAGLTLSDESTKYEAISINVHPQYNPMRLINDIAVIQLVGNVKDATPLALGKSSGVIEGKVYGWGATLPGWENSGYDFTENMQKGEVKVFPDAVCSGKKSFTFNGKPLFPNSTKEVRKNISKFHCGLGVTSDEVNIYEKSEFVDPCYSDAGTGLIDITSNALIGVSTYELGCAGATPKLYTKTHAYTNFIKQFM